MPTSEGGPPPANCQRRLSRPVLGEAAALAVGYLLRAQRPDGLFVYELDWRNGAMSTENSAVRQAGAAWGLGLATLALTATADGGGGQRLAAAAAAAAAGLATSAAAAGAATAADPGGVASVEPPRVTLPTAATTAAAALSALDWWAAHAATAADGTTRWVAFPGEPVGELGAVALVALAHVELLRSGVVVEMATVARLRVALSQYLAFLLAARRPNGVGFYSLYDTASGVPSGDASPYYDGEALLALVKAAKYLGVIPPATTGGVAVLTAVADACHAAHVVGPVAAAVRGDAAETKGYYQWGSMVNYELATWAGGRAPSAATPLSPSGDPPRGAPAAGLPPGLPAAARAVYGRWLVDLATWVVEVHKVAHRRRNTGYAAEGLVHAYAYAASADGAAAGLAHRAQPIGCAVDAVLAKLTTWQVGHTWANAAIVAGGGGVRGGRGGAPRPASALAGWGGIQNHPTESGLRVDTTQHQLHAVLLALRYWARD
ncbi:hypothetical protein MMPV_002867 [Pyropia vietnamensis]